ncbi:MAG: hypothetical protein WA993_01565 [Candidatus Binatus sp.]
MAWVKIAQRFFQPFDPMAFILGNFVEGADRVFDALYGSEGTVSIDGGRGGAVRMTDSSH